MNYFTKKRLIFWGFLLLLILNISALTTVWIQQPGRPDPRPRDGNMLPEGNRFLRRELGLSDVQVKQFEEFQGQHFKQSKAIRDAIRDLKYELFSELSAASPDTLKVERLGDEIGIKQGELEKFTFYHFLELKGVCTTEQQVKMNALFFEMLRAIDPQHRPPPRQRDRRPTPGDRSPRRPDMRQ